MLTALALTLAACHGPTLWIGALEPDAAPAPQRSPMPAHENDASDPTPVDNDAGARPPQDITTPTPAGPTTPPPSMRDASVTLPIDDSDAGDWFPWQTDQPKPTHLPAVRGQCPDLTGSDTYVFGEPRSRTLSVDIYIAPDARSRTGVPGPLILYFHAVGSSSAEVITGLGQNAIDAVVDLGGVVASFNAKLCPSCGGADDVVWYEQDDAVIDQVVACAIDQAHIDTRRIHALGFSAGAMHSLHLALVRSDYIASVISYSGGRVAPTPDTPQDPSNHVPVLLSYGRVGLDFAGVDFPTLSLQWYDEFTAKGWYTMLCDHQGGHSIPGDLVPDAIRFLVDHSYKFAPEPYAGGVPGSFPAYCGNTPMSH
jgi:predicted esterase